MKKNTTELPWAEYAELGKTQLAVQKYIPAADLLTVERDNEQVWLLRKDGTPVLLPKEGITGWDDAIVRGLKKESPSDYLNGMVIKDETGLLLRKIKGEEIEWSIGLSARIVDFLVYGEKIWVATRKELIVLDEEGKLVERLDRKVLSLASGADGVWILLKGEKQLLQYNKDQIQTVRTEKSFGTTIDQFGGVGSLGVEQILWRRDEQGKLKPLFLREDNVLIEREEGGKTSFIVDLKAKSQTL